MFQQISYYTPSSITEELSKNALFQDFNLIWAGIFIHATGHIVQQRCLDEFILIYCIKGKGWLEVDGNQYDILAGDLFLCPPNTLHSYGADKLDPWTKYWVHFTGTKASTIMAYLDFSVSHPVYHVGVNQTMIHSFENIFHVLKNGYLASNLFVASTETQLILSELIRLQSIGPFSEQPDTTIESIIEFMLSNVCSIMTLEDLAEYARLSKYYFIRVFKDKTGYTPVDYFMRLKIQKACEILHSQTLSISELSNYLGFRDQFHFSKVFKKVTGYSPTQYRVIRIT